jgi:two-component system sensor kinase FixL
MSEDSRLSLSNEPPRTLAEARWRAIIDSAVDGIVVIDARGAIESFNPAAERLFGYSEREVVGRNINILMPAPYHEEHNSYLSRYLETGKQKIIGVGREVTGLRRDGTTFPVHLAVGEMVVNGERHFTGILHDLTKRVALEEQFREQASLARLGEMAAVIAHEVRNPLAAVRGAIQVIGGRLPPESKDGPIVTEIIARLDTLNDLLQDLLLFARPPHPKLSAVDMTQLLGIVAGLLSSDPAFTGVQLDIAGDAPAIMGDIELLKIVFQNLIINAAQAMQGQGAIRATVVSDGATVTIQVADTGPGIAREVRDKLFKPFQTTKARGTGLGLSTAKRLVEAHHGTITVDCPPTGGTIVTVQLPTRDAHDKL